MLTHRGFSAWIEVDGQAIPEYLVAVNSKLNQVSCWIPSEESQVFSVHWSDAGGKVDTCSFITLDGVVVPGRFLLGSGTTSRSGVRTSKDTEAPFVFKKSQGGTTLSTASKSEAGMVTLKIKRVDRVSPRPANAYQDLTKIAPAQPNVGDLCAGFGAECKSHEQSPFTWAIKPHDASQIKSKKIATYVSFVFRYRSKEFLQSQGIMEPHQVPDTPSPSIPNRLRRDPVRRIASAPASAAPPTPSPTPPLRLSSKDNPKPYIASPYPLRRPTVDTRRTASWRSTTAAPGSASSHALVYFEYSPDSAVTKDGSDLEYHASE
ncbi:MAG: hypothetical protein NXY57DRAFT_914731 [Lentinula lateritia]|uniref:DOMON domain-containing protein n=1 Tax=Lentinula lateritia TaxID=40482 RepID=A0ABQ8VNI9_9AGAR|nr:MAG: hypothetical protein NXY57DRAFT_914731 [Lentinula lateritia]KAJ4497961.1 hypothetical protein C8R41DRAFT_820349 [Lentinula lateritia]